MPIRQSYHTCGRQRKDKRSGDKELRTQRARYRYLVMMSATLRVIITLVVTATTVASASNTTTSNTTTTSESTSNIPLEDLIDGYYYPFPFNATWISENEILLRNSNFDLVLYNTDTKNSTVLIAMTSKILQNSSAFASLSHDKKYMCLSVNEVSIFESSFNASYAVIELSTGNATYIAPAGVAAENAPLQNFVWAPNGTGFAFVYGNNVYYQANLTATPQQLSTTGQQNVIFNGVTDWVYDEEVFSSKNAIWFSKDGGKMAYATFDDTGVRIMKIPHYAVYGTEDYPYMSYKDIRYPKDYLWHVLQNTTTNNTLHEYLLHIHYGNHIDSFAPEPKHHQEMSGTRNPKVTVTLINLATNKSTVFTVPTNTTDAVLKAVTFAENGQIAIMWNNRVQTSLIINICSEANGTVAASCSTVYKYTESNGWIDSYLAWTFNKQGNSFITNLPEAVGGVRYKQVVQISKGTNNLWTSKKRTNTTHTVAEILRWDDDDVIWYRATGISDRTEQHIYSVNSTGDVSCFTCNVNRTDGGKCLYNSAVFGPGSHVIISCDGPDLSQVFIYNVNGTFLSIWDDRTQLAKLVSSKNLPIVKRMTIPMGDGRSDADALLQLPSDYASRTNIPLLVYVYGGPESALVTQQWFVDWGSSLVSRYGIAAASIDGRGSSLRDVDNLFAVNRRLGTVEIDDQINATRYLQKKLTWVDSNRTCIWGWSYGGYAAAMALARGGDVFKCAMAVAPVVDYHFYDSVYTERYMDTPQNNSMGYANGTLLNDKLVEAFRNKSFLLAHGTEDDNVHFQNSLKLSRMLQRKQIPFVQLSYTDESHGLGGVTKHLYHTFEQFLQNNLFFN